MHVDSARKSGCYWNQMSLIILINLLTTLRCFSFSLSKFFFSWETLLLTRKISPMIVHSQSADMFEVKI